MLSSLACVQTPLLTGKIGEREGRGVCTQAILVYMTKMLFRVYAMHMLLRNRSHD